MLSLTSVEWTLLASLLLLAVDSVQRKYGNAQPVPGEPRNLKIKVLNSTAVSIRWTPPIDRGQHDAVRGYTIYFVAINDGDDEFIITSQAIWVDTPSTEATVSHLLPGTTYQFQVSACTDSAEGRRTKARKAKTLRGPVSGEPRDFKVGVLNSTAVRVQWRPPIGRQQNDTVTGYKIYYAAVGSGNATILEEPRVVNIANGSIAEAIVSHLLPNTIYQFQVSAYTRSNEGRRTKAKNGKTRRPVLGEPPDFKVNVLNSTAVRVQWRPPNRSEQNDTVTGYKIYYAAVGSGNATYLEEPSVVNITNGSVTEAIVSHLLPDTAYQFRVSAYTRSLDGKRTKLKQTRTRGPVPSAPRDVQLTVTHNNPPIISVSWTKPEFSHGVINGYKLLYGVRGESFIHERRFHSETFLFITSNLEMGEDYEFRLSAKNSVDYGEVAVKILRTPDGTPTGAPENVTVVGVSPTSVRLQWDPPAKKRHNGRIVQYEIIYQTNPLEEYTINTTAVTIFVDGLQTGTEYILKLRAYTSKGFGPWSKRFPFRALTKYSSVINEAPQDQNVTIGSSVSLVCRATGNPQPEIYWRRANRRIVTDRQRLSVTDIEHGSVLRIESVQRDEGPVECVADNGVGEPAIAVANIQVSGERLVPSAPRDVQLTLTHNDPPIVSVSWTEPEFPHGVIDGYKLLYGVRGETFIEERQFCSETFLFTTGDLERGEDYEFRLAAKNSVDYGEVAVKSLRTPDSAPTGPPVNVTAIGVSPTSVRLQWDPPAKKRRNGKIVMYEIIYQANHLQEYTVNTTDVTIFVDGLESGTNYVFQLRAYTSKGVGPWSRRLPFRTFANYAPVINEPPRDQKVTNGSSVTLVCRATGNPQPEIYWRRANRRIVTDRQRYTVTGIEHGSVLRIESVQRDEGPVECVADNGVGEPAIAVANIQVSGKELGQ